MFDRSGVDFPSEADEEQMVYGLTISQAMIIFGSLGLLILTRQIIVCTVLGFLFWKVYGFYRERGQANILVQVLYKFGIVVPRSHLFPEPSVDAFRE
jgi:type IV secretory pathway VirB3-like protein